MGDSKWSDPRCVRRLLLISNSRSYGKGYLEHCAEAIREFLGEVTTLTFIPYALDDWDDYTKKAREGFGKFGIEIVGVHEPGVSHSIVVERSSAIFVGGGNTFRLLHLLHMRGLIPAIQSRVSQAMPYLGASAGANVACPTMKTTNDMPIVYPLSFDALNLVPFQINPHFVDGDLAPKHMGETREKRIAEFHEELGNNQTVIGLREGSWIVVQNGVASLRGDTGAKIFRKGEAPVEWDGSLTLWQ